MIDQETPSRSAPRLSVAIVVGRQRERSQQALEAIARQDVRGMEIVLVDVVPAAARLRSPPGAEVREVVCEAVNAGWARAEAVRIARAPVVAFVEEHCIVADGWAEAVLEAFETGPWAAVGYTFGNANPGTWVSRGCHVAAYGPWMAPGGDGEVPDVAGNNLAFRRDLLLAQGDRLPLMLFPDAIMRQQLIRDGRRFFVSAAAACLHESPTRLGFVLGASYAFCRLMAARRVETRGWQPWRRVLYAVGAASAAPALRMWRLLRGVAAHPGRWWAVVEGLPVVLAVYVCGSIGESVGYLFGAGGAADDYEGFELNRSRT